ncbi:hypothetical protein TSOC_009684 [Tetrabaena socialis]|uniref:Uncharacterized protein n=1 Tax=Tetrabaena socialis TaxID=47790 RepID=A0A2J7ZV93_9CHLO|nr:hypothetical protein TSOC_009684 [Tetrabaena socialis]|eukprot:PNH04182.1 hypothetical protein TSOC_009684 [Tetrabaena socialis]
MLLLPPPPSLPSVRGPPPERIRAAGGADAAAATVASNSSHGTSSQPYGTPPAACPHRDAVGPLGSAGAVAEFTRTEGGAEGGAAEWRERTDMERMRVSTSSSSSPPSSAWRAVRHWYDMAVP